MIRRLSTTVNLMLFALGFPNAWAVGPSELIVNGGFEAGFTGWTIANQGSGDWFRDDANGGTPNSSQATLGPSSGAWYAVSDQGGPGVHALHQTFTAPLAPAVSVMLTFDMFVNDWSGLGPIVNSAGLNHNSIPNQHVRVDLLTSAASSFDTGAGVLANFYLGVDAGQRPNPYTAYAFDITSLVSPGGTYQLRFAEVDNQLFLNQGVDDVSILYTSVPEPSTLATMGLAAIVACHSIRHGTARCGHRRSNVA